MAFNLPWQRRRLWEEGIHPPERLKFFSEEKFKVIKALWQEFLKKHNRRSVEKGRKFSVRKAVERPSEDKTGFRTSGFEWRGSSIVDEARWTRFWSWRRVLEREWQMSYEDRYERKIKQIKI